MQTEKTSKNLKNFKERFKTLGQYIIAPAYFKDGTRHGGTENIEVDFDQVLYMNNIRFVKLDDIRESDFEYAVILNPNK